MTEDPISKALREKAAACSRFDEGPKPGAFPPVPKPEPGPKPAGVSHAETSPMSSFPGPEIPPNEPDPAAGPTMPTPEQIREEEQRRLIGEARIKMERAREDYKKAYGLARANRKWFKRILDVNVEETSEEVKAAKGEYIGLQDEYVQLVGEDTKEKALNGGIREEEAIQKMKDMQIYLRVLNGTQLSKEKTQETMEVNVKKGFFSKNVIANCDKAVSWFRKLPLGKRLIVSAAVVGLGVAAALTGAAFLTWLSTGTIVGVRALGSASAGKGIQEWMQARADKKDIKGADANQAEMNAILEKTGETLEQRLSAAQDFLRKDIQALDEKITKAEGKKVSNRRIGVVSGTVLFLAGTAFQIYRAGWFSGGKGAGVVPETKPGAGTVVPEKMPGRSGFPEALEIKKNHSSMGSLRRFALSKFDMITSEGHYNANDALVNDYYQNMKFHHRLPSGLENFEDVKSMPKNSQQEFFKFCDRRMNDYYHGLKRTIVENMRNNPKYYNSLSSEMRQLADSVKNYGDYRNLPPGLKKVVFADREAANWLFDKYHSFQGVPRVKAGQILNMSQDVKGRIFLGDISGIKTGYSYADIPQGKGGAAMAADNYHSKGGGVGESLADQRIRAANEWQARAKANYENVLKGNARNMAGARAAAAAAEAKSVAMDSAQTHKWFDYIQERIYGKGTTMDWEQPAREFRNKFMGVFISSDQPMGPPDNVGDQQNFWRAAQELNSRLGAPIGNETTKEWLTRGLDQGKISSEDALRALNRVVNQ